MQRSESEEREFFSSEQKRDTFSVEPTENVLDEVLHDETPKQSWIKWFWSDMTNGSLIWVKLVFFLQTASLVTLYPYLAIQMRSMGFEANDVALVNSAIPVADIFGPPLAGYLADKIGNFRIFMSSVTFLNGAAALLLIAIPYVTRTTVKLECQQLPENILQCFDFEKNSSRFYASGHVGNGSMTCLDQTGFKIHLHEYRSLEINGSREKMSPDDENNLRCSNISGENWNLTFWTYLLSRVVLDILRASSLMLFEGAVVSIIKEKQGDYGLQKLFCTFGGFMFGPFAGKLIDWTCHNYDAIVYLFFAERLLAALIILKISLSFKPPGKKILKNVGQVLKRLKVLNFLMGYFVAGIVWGFVETFLFWLLEDLGSSSFLMGLSLAMGTLTGLPLTIFSSFILQKLGQETVMIISLAVYGIRLIGYSLMESPELVLLFEALKPVCTSLLTIATFSFIKDESPLTTAATVSGIFGALHYGIGRGIGGFAGGFSIQSHGNQFTFITFAGFSLTMALVCLACVWISRCRSKNH